MELKEARAICKQAASMFRAFAKLEEAAEAIITADNLEKERTEARAKVEAKLTEAMAAYEAEVARNRSTLTEIANQVKYAQGEHKKLVAKLSEKQAEAEASCVAAIAVARNKQALAEDEAQRALEFLTARKDSLESQIHSLEASLEKIKARAAAI